MKVLPRIYYCPQGKEPISSDAWMEKEKRKKKERERENKVFPNVEDRIPAIRPPRTATVAQVREQSPNHRDKHGIG